MKKFYLILVISILVLFTNVTMTAQSFAPAELPEPSSTPTADAKEKTDVDQRVNVLEAQVKALEAQLESLKKILTEGRTVRVPALDENAAGMTTDTAAEMTNAAATEPVTPSPPKKEGDLGFQVGNYRVTPYGIIFFNAFANSRGTNNADDPLWAIPTAQSNAGASGRQTRLGIKFEGGKLGNASVKGVVEADFYGGYPAVGVGENMGVLRLRLANVRLDWESTSLIVGQDWMIFAPNSPTSLAAQAIPQFAAAGNPWARLPQVRVEQKLSDNFKWQGAVLAPQTGDFPSSGNPALLQPGAGAASKVPFFQTRLQYANGNWFGSKSAGTIGIAGHFGRSRISNGSVTENINSYGVAVDWKFPIVKRLTATGEAFLGENLGGFQAGIFQGYNSDFGAPAVIILGATPAGIRGIRTRGGWLQIGWNIPAFEDRLSLYGSFGIDDPRNRDLISVSNRNFRSQNFGYAFDAIYNISDHFSLGGEFRRLETRYILGSRAESNHFNLGARYTF